MEAEKFISQASILPLQIRSAFITKEKKKDNGHWISNQRFLSFLFCRDAQKVVLCQNSHMIFSQICMYSSKLVRSEKRGMENMGGWGVARKKRCLIFSKSTNYPRNYLTVRIRRLTCSLKNSSGSKKRTCASWHWPP